MQTEERGRRASPDNVRRRHIARDFVSPLNCKIGRWAEQAAFLRARINGRHVGEEGRATARAEAGGLSLTLVREMAEFERELAGLPPEIRKSSEIEDTYRAMQSVIRNLRQSVAED